MWLYNSRKRSRSTEYDLPPSPASSGQRSQFRPGKVAERVANVKKDHSAISVSNLAIKNTNAWPWLWPLVMSGQTLVGEICGLKQVGWNPGCGPGVRIAAGNADACSSLPGRETEISALIETLSSGRQWCRSGSSQPERSRLGRRSGKRGRSR